MARLDIFWSFRSPYSYLAIDRLCDIAHDYAVETRFRPVRPLAMREPDFFERGRKQFLPYLMRDFPREAERLGLSFAMPQPDPIDMDMGTGKVAPAQPRLARVMDLAVAAVVAGRGLEFARAMAHRIWNGRPWTDAASGTEAARAAGLDLAALDQWIAGNRDAIERMIAENEAEQLGHHWGVPLMVLDGEPFFGQDRLDSLVWRMDKSGLKRA